MSKHEVTLFAEPTSDSLELQRELERGGLAVRIVYCNPRPGVPYVESTLATIHGYQNIRRFFVT